MSYRVYNQEWEAAQEDLAQFLQEEETLRETLLFKRNALVSALQRLYVRCLLITRSLNTCHDQLRQPQRRLLLRTLLDLTLVRQLEIKHELCFLDASDTLHCDHLLSRFKIQPQQLLVTIPSYFTKERQQALEERERSIAMYLERAGVGAVEEAEPLLSVSEAIAILQRHERARQARNRALHFRAIATSKDRERGRGRVAGAPGLTTEQAVVRLQAYVRGTLARRHVHAMRQQEKLFLDMEAIGGHSEHIEEKLSRVRDANYEGQEILAQDLQRQQHTIRNKILFGEGLTMMHELEENLREWIFQVKRDTGKFPELPDEEEGGSAAVEGLRDPLKAPATPSIKDGERPPPVEPPPPSTEQPDEEEEPQVVQRQSAVLDQLKATCLLYQDVWHSRGAGDVTEDVEKALVEEEEREEVKALLRKKVDAKIRQQLQQLKEEVEGEKRGSRKKKKTKKGSKKGRRRREKDLTPDRSTESLFEELTINGIVKSVAKGPDLSDLSPDICLVGSQQMHKTGWPTPQYGDFLNTLVEYVALPLGLTWLHDAAQSNGADSLCNTLVRSVLMAGSRGAGKTAALLAVCRATGALLLDLSAANIVGRYPGRAGLSMLIHLVLKVGRLLQPTIILVDDAEKTFLKKVPRTDKSEPRRLRKELPRLVKNITPEDRIVLVGISSSPWNCDLKSLTSVYQKIVLVPRPTYSGRSKLWRQLLSDCGAPTCLSQEISCLARISDGYTTGQISHITKQVVMLKKKMAKDTSPICIQEFIPYMAKQEPIYREEEEAFTTWFLKTPLMKKRIKLFEEQLLKVKSKGSSEKGKNRSKVAKKKK